MYLLKNLFFLNFSHFVCWTPTLITKWTGGRAYSLFPVSEGSSKDIQIRSGESIWSNILNLGYFFKIAFKYLTNGCVNVDIDWPLIRFTQLPFWTDSSYSTEAVEKMLQGVKHQLESIDRLELSCAKKTWSILKSEDFIEYKNLKKWRSFTSETPPNKLQGVID